MVSVLVSLEGCLCSKENDRDVYQLLQSVFICLAVAMRYEPANGWHFQTEIAGADSSNFVTTVRNLGCFNPESRDIRSDLRDRPEESVTEAFHSVFHSAVPFSADPDNQQGSEAMSGPLYSATVVMRLLYDMALDNYDNKALFLT